MLWNVLIEEQIDCQGMRSLSHCMMEDPHRASLSDVQDRRIQV